MAKMSDSDKEVCNDYFLDEEELNRLFIDEEELRKLLLQDFWEVIAHT